MCVESQVCHGDFQTNTSPDIVRNFAHCKFTNKVLKRPADARPVLNIRSSLNQKTTNCAFTRYRRRRRDLLLTPLRCCSAAVRRRVSRGEAAAFCWLMMARSRRLLHSCLGRARGVAASQGTALAGLGYKRAKLQLVVGMGVQTRRHLLCGNKQHLLWNSRLRPRGKKLDLLTGMGA